MVDPDPRVEEEFDAGTRQLAVAGLLRQVSNGLASYRLYPGDWEQPAFLAAVERVRAAAEEALVTGTVVVEIQGDRFFTSDGPLPADDSLVRLALACYERRMNILRVRAAPEPYELAAFYDILVTRRDEIESPQQVEESLRDARVVSIALGKVELMPVETALGDRLTEEQAEFWDVLERGEDVEAGGDPLEEASALYSRFRGLVAALPSEFTDDPELYRRMQGLVERLPRDTRKALASQLMDRMDDEPVAERIINTMTDADLARTIADMSSEGEEALGVASNLVASGFRQRDLVDLTQAIVMGQQESGTILAGAGANAPTKDVGEVAGELGVASEDDQAQRETVMETVSDIMAQRLRDTEQEDSGSIKSDFPTTFDQLMDMGEATFQDYLALDDDMERLEQVLDVWAQEARDALSAREYDRAARLVNAAEHARIRIAALDPEREQLFLTYRRRVLDISLLSDLVGSSHNQAFTPLLAAFGPAGVEAMMDLLAEEQDRSRRAALVSAISDMAKEYKPVIVARLSDPRWYVVRNAVVILRQSGAGGEFLADFEKAAKHDHPAVRREAIRGLVVAAGPDVSRHLRRLLSRSRRERAASSSQHFGGHQEQNGHGGPRRCRSHL